MLKISFFSNYLNAHQLPIAQWLASMPEVEYTHVSLVPGGSNVGRSNLDNCHPFVLRSYVGPAERAEAMKHVLSDDVVIFQHMAGHEEYVKARAETGLFFFRSGERILKRGDWWRFVPPKRWRTWDWFGRYKHANMRALCIGSMAARDLSLFGFPVDKCLKWGYFPQIVEASSAQMRDPSCSQQVSLCSVQRQIPWKRVDLQLKAAAELKSAGIPFHLTIAGDGECRPELERLAGKLGVDKEVSFVGTLSSEDTRQLMLSSDVFLATSDGNEGWGCTINEAMAAGCAVVASDMMGSVGFLIKGSENGVSFRSGDVNDLAAKLRAVCTSSVLRSSMGTKARGTVAGEWGAECAAKRLVELSRRILSGEDFAFSSGPLSRNGSSGR